MMIMNLLQLLKIQIVSSDSIFFIITILTINSYQITANNSRIIDDLRCTTGDFNSCTCRQKTEFCRDGDCSQRIHDAIHNSEQRQGNNITFTFGESAINRHYFYFSPLDLPGTYSIFVSACGSQQNKMESLSIRRWYNIYLRNLETCNEIKVFVNRTERTPQLKYEVGLYKNKKSMCTAIFPLPPGKVENFIAKRLDGEEGVTLSFSVDNPPLNDTRSNEYHFQVSTGEGPLGTFEIKEELSTYEQHVSTTSEQVCVQLISTLGRNTIHSEDYCKRVEVVVTTILTQKSTRTTTLAPTTDAIAATTTTDEGAAEKSEDVSVITDQTTPDVSSDEPTEQGDTAATVDTATDLETTSKPAPPQTTPTSKPTSTPRDVSAALPTETTEGGKETTIDEEECIPQDKTAVRIILTLEIIGLVIAGFMLLGLRAWEQDIHNWYVENEDKIRRLQQ